MGDTNNEKRNATQLNKRNDSLDVNSKNECGELVDNKSLPSNRPIPNVFPRFPYDLNLGNVKGVLSENSLPCDMRNKHNLSSRGYHNARMVDQGLQMGANVVHSGGIPNVPTCPYVLTLFPSSVSSQNINSQSRAHPVSSYSSGHYLHNTHNSPYVRVPLVDPMYYQNQRSYQYGYRVPTHVRNHENVYWGHQQFYRSKPGSVYGIPPEPRMVQPDYHRMSKPYNFLFQPNTIRIFNDYRSNYQRQETNDLKNYNNFVFNNNIKNNNINNTYQKQNKTQAFVETDLKKENIKDKSTVHIGGLLTLPRSLQSFSDESSQSSTTSSQRDEESTKIAFTMPEMVLFKKFALNGCKDLEKLISKYNVKSSRIDLDEFCKSVKCNLIASSPGLIQMEPVLREMILAFLHISSSWVSLASILPIMKEQPNPLDNSLEPLAKEFHQWQEISKLMLEKITTALREIPTEHERFVSGAYKKNDNLEVNKPSSDSESVNASNEEWSMYDNSVFPNEHISREREHQVPIGNNHSCHSPSNYDYNYPFSADTASSEFQTELHKVHLSPNMPLNFKNQSTDFKEWDDDYNSTTVYSHQYENEKSRETNLMGDRFIHNSSSNESLSQIDEHVKSTWNDGK